MIVDQERIVITQPIVNPWLTNRKTGVRLVSSTIIHHAVVLKELHSGGVVLTGRPNQGAFGPVELTLTDWIPKIGAVSTLCEQIDGWNLKGVIVSLGGGWEDLLNINPGIGLSNDRIQLRSARQCLSALNVEQGERTSPGVRTKASVALS